MGAQVKVVVLDAWGVLYSSPEYLSEFFIPFVRSQGCILSNQQITDLCIDASLRRGTVTRGPPCSRPAPGNRCRSTKTSRWEPRKMAPMSCPAISPILPGAIGPHGSDAPIPRAVRSSR